MDLLLTVDHHFIETPDGRVWCPTIHDSKFWDRYKATFEKIYVICRYKKTSNMADVKNYLLSSADRVEFIGIRDFVGPKEYLKNVLHIKKELKEKLIDLRKSTNFVPIFRLPSTIGFLAFDTLSRIDKKIYGVELVADPSTAYGGAGFSLGSLIGKQYEKKVKTICAKASSVGYVTKQYLQAKYPTHEFSINYSSGGIDKKDYVVKSSVGNLITFVHVSNMHSDLKGIDTLAKAMYQLKNSGYQFQCFLVGEGRHRQGYEELIKSLDLQNEVTFTGGFSDYTKIKEILTKSDILIFPSHSEGLPRAVIEAMSCSLAVVASPVGGTPELLPPEFLVAFHDVNGYFSVMKKFLDNPSLILSTGEENYRVALDYSTEELNKRRRKMYQELVSRKEANDD